MLSLVLVSLCLAVVIALYFYNNPMGHSRWYVMRRFINWFPLGMTYAFLYMGRYNLNVSKTALGAAMSKEDFGWIFAVGTWVYALSFLVNGPLVDKIGGKRGIIIAAVGASAANIALGVLTYLVVAQHLKLNLILAFSVVYGLNMYFQSYGAVSIIKVKAYWFHVRERGVFGAIFGTLISFGVYFAFDWGQAVVDMTRVGAGARSGWLPHLLRGVFALKDRSVDPTWAVFYVPAVILLFWAVVDALLIRDTPEEAKFEPLETHDGSSGQMHVELTTRELLAKVFTSPLMLMFAAIELTAGVLRNGTMQWYPIFAKEMPRASAASIAQNWGLLVCMFGIIGGFAGGLISDKLFQSRRGPPAALLCGFMFVLAGIMAACLFAAPIIVGSSALLISMAVIGVHALMSGTAAADFGGRKATATCSGIVDGFVYLGSGLQSVSLGYLTTRSWHWWPLFLMPFALLGGFLALRIWHELPAATRRFNQEMEQAGICRLPAAAAVTRKN